MGQMATRQHSDTTVDQLWEDFHSHVNLTSGQLRDWLLTEGSGESAFPDALSRLPEPSRAILTVLGKRRMDLTEADRRVMSETIAGIRDLLDRRPPAGGADDGWRHALLDLGHDPLREPGAGTGTGRVGVAARRRHRR